MGSTQLLPLLTNTSSTTLTVWLYCQARSNQPLQERVAQGWQQFDQGDIVAAIACFQAVLGRAQALGDNHFADIARNSLRFVEQALVDLDDDLAVTALPNHDRRDGDPVTSQPGQTGLAHLSAAQAALQTACFAAALQHLDQALHQFTRQANLTGVGQTLSAMATVHLATADYSRSLTYGQAAIAVLEDCDAQPNLAQTLQTLGLANVYLGNLAAAQTQLEQAATLYHHLGDTRAEGILLKQLGQVYRQQKAFMFALAAYEAALDCCLDLPATSQDLTAAVLHHTGQLYEDMGHNDFAIAPYRDALETYRKLGDFAKATLLLQHLGRLYEGQGQYAMAVECYHQLQQLPTAQDNAELAP
ncbi:MAG: tetratricopeptide repeat protein [Leptolyngbya sp. RL_3_1]|nr:tetratricopeptide repeat protein [Leptolyngbya sp. RL_3_1]